MSTVNNNKQLVNYNNTTQQPKPEKLKNDNQKSSGFFNIPVGNGFGGKELDLSSLFGAGKKG